MFPFSMDIMALLGIQDPMALATLMAQNNVSPEALTTGLQGGGDIGALAQPQEAQTPQVMQASFRPQQPSTSPSSRAGDLQEPNDFVMERHPSELPNAPNRGTRERMLQGPFGEQGGRVPPVMEVGLTSDQIRSEFMSTLQRGGERGGITNPHALAAVEATVLSESGWDPSNVFGTWSDPSESGIAGTSGGAMSWRGPRLTAMQRFAARMGDDPSAPSPSSQAAFFLAEDPGLIAKLNAAKSPAEAQTLMNNAWQFAGYNRAGGEASERIALANRLSGSQPSPGALVTSGDTSRTGSTIDFARSTGASIATPPLATDFGTDVAGGGTFDESAPFPAAPAQPKTLAEKLAAIGKGLKVPEDKQGRKEPPRITGGLTPSQGSFGRDPQSIERMFALLGGAAPTAGATPLLSQLIQGVK